MATGIETETARQKPDLAALIGQQTAARKSGRRRWLIALALLLIAAGAGWFLLAGRNTAAYTYNTSAVTKGELTVIVTATGTVQPVAKVDVSSPISGIVRKVNVDYNSAVKRGDVLAELDRETLLASEASARAQLAVARANVAKAEAQAEAARATLTRQTALSEQRIISTQTLEDARLSAQSAEAALKAAGAEVMVSEANLKMATTNLDRAVITSPIDGVVLTRSIDEGATVAASLQAPVLFSIAGDLSKMELQVDVDEADIGGVSVGDKASFTVDAYRNRSFPAEITDIRFVSETINNVVTYKALLKVDNGDLLLRPGMTATADIVEETVKDALLVPNTALRYVPPAEAATSGGFSLFRPPRGGALTKAEPKSGSRSLWVLRDGVPVEVPVEIGQTDGRSTVITKGEIAEGDLVVTEAVAAK